MIATPTQARADKWSEGPPSLLDRFQNFDVELTRLRAAIDVVLTVPGPPPDEVKALREEHGKLSDRVGPAPANMLLIAMDLLFSVADGAQVSTVKEVLFSCYDVAMQTQGFGRSITLEQQTANEVCLDVIRKQKELVAGR